MVKRQSGFQPYSFAGPAPVLLALPASIIPVTPAPPSIIVVRNSAEDLKFLVPTRQPPRMEAIS